MVVHKDRAEICMVDLLPKCVKCGCNVADSVEPEVERAAHLKLGQFGYVMIVSGRQRQAELMFHQILHELMKRTSLSIFCTRL